MAAATDSERKREQGEKSSTASKLGLSLGNPVESETAAFSWLIMVMLGAASVVVVGKLISTLAGMIWLAVLLAVVSVLAFRGLKRELSSPDEDEEL